MVVALALPVLTRRRSILKIFSPLQAHAARAAIVVSAICTIGILETLAPEAITSVAVALKDFLLVARIMEWLVLVNGTLQAPELFRE